ncbi:MAG: hypothetical protein DYG92_09805 [Leptolyngbya sp. PLA1]|nr:hypothetical protein [Leptolyngbya sp. PLA1]
MFARVVTPGAFLAASWTWCIGMFLPILLARDFGPWAYLVFALPNCVGAGVMGRVISRHGASNVLAAHKSANLTFGVVTMAFQWFFLIWLLADSPREHMLRLIPATIIGMLLATWWRSGRFPGGLGGVAAVVISLALGAAWLIRGDVPGVAPPAPLRPLPELLPLAGVCALGFLLCPYLDRTFLQTADACGPEASPAAFVVGFLAIFPLLILITHLAWPSLGVQAGPLGPSLYPALLSLHVAMQLGFTIAAHDRSIPDQPARSPVPSLQGGIAFLIGAALAGAAGFLPLGLHGLESHEVVYRGFMAFYGLIFPAYVWCCMVPGGWACAPTRRRLLACAAAVVLAAPFFYLGMMMRETWWLFPGVSMVLAARWLAPAAEPDKAGA